jgi:hypothetical protein
MRKPLVKIMLYPTKKAMAVAKIPLHRRTLQTLWARKYTAVFLTGASLVYLYRDHLALTYHQLIAKMRTKTILYSKQLEDGSKEVLKDVVVSTLRTQPVESGGVEYLLTLLKDKQVVDQLLSTLLTAIKSDSFIDQAKVLGKDIVKNATGDKEVEDALTNLFVRIFKTPEIKTEAKDLVVHVVEQEEVRENLIKLVQVAFADNRVVDGMRDMLTHSFYQLLNQPETADHFQQLMLNVVQSLDKQKNNGPLNQLIQGVAMTSAPVKSTIVAAPLEQSVAPAEKAQDNSPEKPQEEPVETGGMVWQAIASPVAVISKIFMGSKDEVLTKAIQSPDKKF